MTTTDHQRTWQTTAQMNGMSTELVEVFRDAIDDTTAKTQQLATILDHLNAARALIGPRLAKGWHVHHDQVDHDQMGDTADHGRGVMREAVAIAEPATAPATLAAAESAREHLAVLIDAFRACLHAQIETAHDLSLRAHQTRACTGLTTCPHCPPLTDNDDRCESCRVHTAVTTWPHPADVARSDAAGESAPFRVCTTCQPARPAPVEHDAPPASAR